MRESGVYTANIIIESKLLVAFLRSSQRLVDGIRATETKKPKKFAMYQKKIPSPRQRSDILSSRTPRYLVPALAQLVERQTVVGSSISVGQWFDSARPEALTF